MFVVESSWPCVADECFETSKQLLWAPNGGTLYWDEGTSAISLPAINALSGSAGNLSADPMLDATFHQLLGSPGRNAGTATNI